MSTSQETSPVVLLFPVFYLAALYSAVHFGDWMLDMSYEASWQRIPDAAAKLKALLYIYPAVSIPLSIAVLAAMQQSAKVGGKGALFLIGAAACAAGNLMSFQGLKMLVGWGTVSQWSALLNTHKLNLLTSVIAPVAAFVAAYLTLFCVFGLKAWLKPE